MVVEPCNIGSNDLVGCKIFKKCFGEHTPNNIIIELLSMNLASDYLKKTESHFWDQIP